MGNYGANRKCGNATWWRKPSAAFRLLWLSDCQLPLIGFTPFKFSWWVSTLPDPLTLPLRECFQDMDPICFSFVSFSFLFFCLGFFFFSSWIWKNNNSNRIDKVVGLTSTSCLWLQLGRLHPFKPVSVADSMSGPWAVMKLDQSVKASAASAAGTSGRITRRQRQGKQTPSVTLVHFIVGKTVIWNSGSGSKIFCLEHWIVLNVYIILMCHALLVKKRIIDNCIEWYHLNWSVGQLIYHRSRRLYYRLQSRM